MFIKEELSLERVSLGEIKEQALAIQEKRTDYVVPNISQNLIMDKNGTINMKPIGRNRNMRNIEMTDWALGQLSAKVGVPAEYTRKCLAKMPELGAKNINSWLKELDTGKRGKSGDVLVRTFDGRVDGILSTGYSKFDSDKIVDAIDKSLHGDYIVKGYYLSDERMHLRLIDPNMINLPGEDLFPAIFVDSSDVGRRSIDIHFGIWKKVCTNGLCINRLGGSLYHQRHVGVRVDNIYAEMKSNLQMIPELVTLSVEKIKEASQQTIRLNNEDEFNKIVRDLKRILQVNEEQVQRILDIAVADYEATRWGITNGITKFAQEFGIDDRYRLEQAAGQFLLAH